MKNYVGRKIRGFRFEDGTDGVKWNDRMEAYISRVGQVMIRDNYNDPLVVEFDDGNTWVYPISLIEPHLIEEEIPQLGEGVLMKVSEDGVNYKKTYVIAILADGRFLDRNKLSWKHARPIPKLPQYTHAELVEQLGHDFEYGGK